MSIQEPVRAQPALRPLPRLDDLPSSADGYDRVIIQRARTGAEQPLSAAGHGDAAIHEAVDAIVRAAEAVVRARRGPGPLATTPVLVPATEPAAAEPAEDEPAEAGEGLEPGASSEDERPESW